MKEERSYTLEQINDIVGGILNKIDSAPVIKRIAPPKLADENTLALALSEEEIENLYSSEAKAALVPLGVSFEGMTTIEVERPRLAMMKLLHLFYQPPRTQDGIHPTAVVDETAKIGENHATFESIHGTQYLEAHHLIPMKAQKDFLSENINLDRLENIVALCPNCHKAVHYGTRSEN